MLGKALARLGISLKEYLLTFSVAVRVSGAIKLLIFKLKLYLEYSHRGRCMKRPLKQVKINVY